jgi:hypothetical protein
MAMLNTNPHGLRDTALFTLLAVALSVVALGGGAGWTGGVIGGGDAWQNVWNIDHINNARRGSDSLLSTRLLWAPAGASLLTHTLVLPLTTLGAGLMAWTGPSLAYNLLVVLSFALAAAGTFHVARALGLGAVGAGIAGLIFTFGPARFARAYGHLNLLALGLVGFALAGFLAVARGRHFTGAAQASLATWALLLCDYYLGILGIITIVSFLAIEVVRTRPLRRVRPLVITAVIILAPLGFLALVVTHEGSSVTGAHPSQWCSAAITSLVIPGRTQALSSLTRPLTERNHQNLVEGVAYLGLVPLILTALALRRDRPRHLDFLAIAGGIALVLSLGPRLRVFDILLPIPLPYAALERLVPGLRLGGCVNRFLQLVYLPLGIYAAIAITRVRRRLAQLVLCALIALEYAPRRIPIAPWPASTTDAVLTTIKDDPSKSIVLDLDGGVIALVRQLAHRHPLTNGYVSRPPAAPAYRQSIDRVLQALQTGDEPVTLQGDTLCAYLEYRYGIRYVIGDRTPEREARLARTGLPFHTSDTLLLADLSELPPGEAAQHPERRIVFGQAAVPDAISVDREPSTLPEAGILLSTRPGAYRLTLRLPPPEFVGVTINYGMHAHAISTMVYDHVTVSLSVTPDDLVRDRWLGITVRPERPGLSLELDLQPAAAGRTGAQH